MDKILSDIPAVVAPTEQGAMVFGMFRIATLLHGVNLTALFAIYIVFWSLQYTSAFRAYLDDRESARINA